MNKYKPYNKRYVYTESKSRNIVRCSLKEMEYISHRAGHYTFFVRKRRATENFADKLKHENYINRNS